MRDQSATATHGSKRGHRGCGIRSGGRALDRLLFFKQFPDNNNGRLREGDIRHNAACTKQIKETLGFVPSWSFAEGLQKFLDWAESQQLDPRRYEESLDEMRKIGLMHG